ncbi:MAG TPA: hypothetical protein VGB20_00750 [bacterium]
MSRARTLLWWGVLTMSVAAERMIREPHGHHDPWWHVTPGAYAILGLVFSLGLVATARILGASGIEHNVKDGHG